jgi:hypothetical protein
MLRLLPLGAVVLTLASAAAPDAHAAPLATWQGDAARDGDLTLPAAWAGIWIDADSLHLCSDPTVFFAITDTDTLCAGDPIEEEIDGVVLDCSGTYDDDSADIICVGGGEISPGCTVEYELTIVATRNGDSAFATTTINTTYLPPGCDGEPDTCVVVETTSTRIGPPPPDCVTAVEAGTWGRIKARYR